MPRSPHALLALPSLSALLLAAACGTSIHTTPLNASPRPMAPRPIEDVELYTSGPPAAAHVDVALIEVEEASQWSTADTAEVIHDLRQRAAELGCDAVVVGGTAARQARIDELQVDDARHVRRGFWGTCVVYRPGAPGELAAR